MNDQKLDKEHSEKDNMIMEARCKVYSVRTFWRDKIFREQSRAGIIKKRSLQTIERNISINFHSRL